ncbi:MAG TPA: hypothetical protein VGU66_05445 [Candidatus Elarobacter sp.]|nr:hypothetical protein [Candidatus Elarobacter sp.]
MRLPGFLRDLIGAMTVHACDTAQAELRANFVDGRETLREVAQSIVGRLFDAAREDVRRDFERMALFGLLFRSQADQSRRVDSIDATLGVVLTALLVLAPIAFDKGPTQADKWIALVGFGVLVAVIGRGLFFVLAREPDAPALGAKLLGDLKEPVAGTLEELRSAISLSAANPRQMATKNEAVRRGATNDLVQLIAEREHCLDLKRFHLGLALSLFVVLTGIIGWRDVVQSTPEVRRNGPVRIHREVVESAHPPRRAKTDSGIRGPDLR